MSAARMIILSLALIAAIGLAVVVRGMMVSKRAPVAVAQAKAPPPVPLVRILVAKRDLPIGTRLAPADLGWQPWPAEGLNPNFISDGARPAPAPTTATEKAAAGAAKVVQQISGSTAIDSLVGTIVHDPIAAGEPIQQGSGSKLVRGGDGGYLAVVLPPGMQALGIPVKTENVAGGFILPGDRVDVLQSREVEGTNNQPSSRVTGTVVTNVRVLTVDQTDKPKDTANFIVGTVVTVAVTPAAAQALVEAMAQGDLHLSLRSYADINAPSAVTRPVKSVQAGQVVKILGPGDEKDVTVTQ